MIHRSPYVTESVRQKAAASEREAEDLVSRSLRCPNCGYVVGVVFSDATGHMRTKCQKCKAVSVLNLAYFHRQKQRKSLYRIAD